MAEQQKTPEFINDPTGHGEDVEDYAPFERPQDNSSTATLESNTFSDMVRNSVRTVENKTKYFESSKKFLKSRPDAEYDMRHKRRGPALIFNQYTFQEKEKLQKRTASDLDVAAFEKQLERLGFDVQLHVDYTKADLLDKIQRLSEEDHTQNDCILIAIFSHGSYNGIICAHDTWFKLNEILEKFTDRKCPTLKGKLKLFFLQCCQGSGKDLGGEIEESDDMKKRRMESRNELLQHPDFLIAHPAAHGLKSWRRRDYGTWFIQKLCEQLEKNGTNLDLMTILTHVSHDVALHETANSRAKQVPCITSMLTRIVRFDDKKHQPGTNH